MTSGPPVGEQPPAVCGIALDAHGDVAAGARRAESLGFGHVALPGASTVGIVLALGATTGVDLLVDERAAPLVEQIPDAVAGRLRVRTGGWPLLPVRAAGPGIVGADAPVAAPWPVLYPVAGDGVQLRSRLAVAASGTGPVTLLPRSGPRATVDRLLALEVLGPAVARRGTDAGPIHGEELEVGSEYDLGTYAVTAREIVDFAEHWDPLEFHLDADAARRAPLGVLCASGIHTMAIMQRLLARALVRRLAVVGGRGLSDMRLRRPVVDGMALHGQATIRAVEHRAERSVVTLRSTLEHDGSLVLEQVGDLLMLRHAAVADEPVAW